MDQHDPPDRRVQWEKITDAITETTKSAATASPVFDVTQPLVFQRYWRGVFVNLEKSISEDSSIPEYLTEPPATKLTVRFFDDIHGLACACCHPDVDPSVILEKSDGVTKRDLVKGICDVLYGDSLPKVYIEPEPFHREDSDEDGESADTDSSSSESTEDDESAEGVDFQDNRGVVVVDSSWLNSAKSEGDVRYAYSDEPEIFLYCCGFDEFETKTAQWEESRRMWSGKGSKDIGDS